MPHHLLPRANAVGESAAVSVDHYENFPVASWLCPAPMRGAVRAIYHYARCADDIADEGDASTPTRLASLERYREALELTISGVSASNLESSWQPIFDALNAAIRKYQLPAQPLRDLLDAFEQDVHNPTYPDRASLLDYCSRSAHPVGRLLMHLYGIDDAMSLRRSDAVCAALQLINFWQDLSVDLPRHRLYVPLDDLARHGLAASDLVMGDSASTRVLVADLVAWARTLMMEGAPLVHRVPGRAGWELRFVVHGGLRILDKIEQLNFNVLSHRPRLFAVDALALTWRALRMRDAPSAPARAHDLA